ncbi:hypothetical protein ACFQ3J_00460 [Paenibacillus provencensis]|uniref:Uncharacterized protein n=1 Tax=Paenibacillus provencensis TaxID=441151 RepID=A0ABW3PSI2_9BACL
MVEPFTKWYKANKAAFELENEILRDKLAQGVNGIEWLVLQVVADEDRKSSLEMWLNHIRKYKLGDINKIIVDALIMDGDSFYIKYQINWWVSVDEALTYLSLLKERNYEHYFETIKIIKTNMGRKM